MEYNFEPHTELSFDYDKLIKKYHKEQKTIEQHIDKYGFPPRIPVLVRCIGYHKWMATYEICKSVVSDELECLVQADNIGTKHYLYRDKKHKYWSITKSPIISHEISKTLDFYEFTESEIVEKCTKKSLGAIKFHISIVPLWMPTQTCS